jgi:hypothetical protein
MYARDGKKDMSASVGPYPGPARKSVPTRYLREEDEREGGGDGGGGGRGEGLDEEGWRRPPQTLSVRVSPKTHISHRASSVCSAAFFAARYSSLISPGGVLLT